MFPASQLQAELDSLESVAVLGTIHNNNSDNALFTLNTFNTLTGKVTKKNTTVTTVISFAEVVQHSTMVFNDHLCRESLLGTFLYSSS